MPSLKNIKLLQRHRQKNNAAPAVPTSLSELVIPDSYKGYKGELFLQHDSGPEPEIILIFTNTQNFEYLFNSKGLVCRWNIQDNPNFVQPGVHHSQVAGREHGSNSLHVAAK